MYDVVHALGCVTAPVQDAATAIHKPCLEAAQGYVDVDNLTLGTPPITIPSQDFGEALLVSDDFLQTSCDGLFVRPDLCIC